jgi:hypothetical protein
LDDFNQYKLGENKEQIALETIEQNRNAALCLATQASRSLCIFSHELDPLIYDTSSFVEAVKNLAIRHRHTSIQIVIQDSQKIVNQGHRLVELMRRLTSSIQIRKTPPELKTVSRTFLIADATGILYRNNVERYEGYVNFDTRYECKNVLKFFNNAWEKSQPDPELRRLYI